MMVTAQCPSGTAGGCSHTSRITKLRDRTGAFLPVKNRCVFCYNTIFNSLPLSLAGCGDEVERLGAESLRLSFTVESREETERILRAADRPFIPHGAIPYRNLPEGISDAKWSRRL